MIKIRCKSCNTEYVQPSRRVSCGCNNKMTIDGDKVTAIDLSLVEIIKISDESVRESSTYLSHQDLEFQENRKKRKVRKLDFEVR